MEEEIVEAIKENPERMLSFKKEIILTSVMFFILAILISFMLFVGSFSNFEQTVQIEIKDGSSLKEISSILKENKIIYSRSLLNSMVMILNGESHIYSGTYTFTKKEGDYYVAKRIINGDFRIQNIKITIPEGFNTYQIAERLEKNIPNFSKENFLELIKNKEGYLFPETYFFSINTKSADIAKKLEETFWQKMEENFDIKKDSKEFQDTLILASIVEEEVRNLEDKKIVAGIFLNRLKIGMSLQADSTLAYVTGRDSLSLTQDDLKIENAYNSYKNKGLPPTPISNPGLESIEATLHPTETKYLYFLTDKEGKVYYAKTFEEHKLNKQKYLR